MTEWRPLFARFDAERAKDYDALHDGVPPWIARSLLTWVSYQIDYHDQYTPRATEEHLRELERVLRHPLDWGSGERSASGSLRALFAADGEIFLSATDHLLANLSHVYDDEEERARGELATILREAGSVWEVTWHGDRHHPFLSRRVLPEAEGVFNAAIAPGDRAADYLRQSWERAFGRDANPDGAYRDAVRALEAVLKPTVSPDNTAATLGTIIRDIRAKPSKFAVRLEPTVGNPVEIFASEFQMLWTAELDRHGTDDETKPLNVSIEQARDAAVRAAALIQVVRSGGFWRV